MRGIEMHDELYPCPCCGFLMFPDPPGSYDICLICRWEDDPVQLNKPDYAGGANDVSLWDCQQEILREVPPHLTTYQNRARASGWRPLTQSDLKQQLASLGGGFSFKYYWEDEPRSGVTGQKPS